MRSVAHHDIGARIDGGMSDIRHVLQRLTPKPPMAGGDDDVGLRPQRRDVLLKFRQIRGVRPCHDERRHAGPVWRRHAGGEAARRHLIGGVAADHGDAG